MEITILSRGQLSEEQLAVIEHHLGVHLPEDYRRFLLRYNGGKPQPNGFDIPAASRGASNASSVRAFFGVRKGRNYNLLKEHQNYEGRMPSHLLPVAEDDFGNLVVLSVTGTDVGTVYFWDHESEADEGEVPGYTNIHKVADTFSDFLNRLKEFPDVELADEDVIEVWVAPDFLSEETRKGNIVPEVARKRKQGGK